MERVKLIDVAREAGVHTATASRALNPAMRDAVSRKTVRRVEQAAQRLGYVPNALARGLRTARSNVIALIIPDITNALFPALVRGAAQVLGTAGYILVLTDTNNDPAAEHAQLASMRARGADGFIVATANWQDPQLDELADTDLPVVLVNRQTSARSLPYIGADDQRGIQLCVDHLAALGHRRIVHLAGPADTSTGMDRTTAFRQAMRAHGLPAGASAVKPCAAFTEEAGIDATRKLLASGQPFTAVVAGNDLLALGAMAVLRDAGVPCPEQVSVTGFNDLPFMDKLTPALTTVRLPMHDMGALAGHTMLDWIASPRERQPTQTLLPVELIVRGTTRPAPQPPRPGRHATQ